MKHLITYGFLLFILLTGCEDIYRPDIDEVDNVLVADARISADNDLNYVYLYESVGYYENASSGPAVTDATVSLIDNDGFEYQLPHYSHGQYVLNLDINPDKQYHLKIEYNGDVYESEYEQVPQKPSMDTVYGEEETLVQLEGGENDVDNVKEVKGVRLYTDISSNEEMPYYRFTTHYILQYSYSVPGEGLIPMPDYYYGWKHVYPQSESFNIASPPEYSASKAIKKHPLFFVQNSRKDSVGHIFEGWIVILYQHAITENAYGYYDDLNKQLAGEGKIFDPLYVQARSNMECTTNSDQIILGNFEISSSNETRYYVRYISEKNGFILRPIEEFYEIPPSGEMKNIIPEFWQYP
ncbi:DUF4249 domain-containing protein [Draconibacterium sp. IB214405]|uniref:DUF4249 domain-containing protein n=1 Tax=Draconibacterium sp. IB214405 TaxID=3097352 RepID=UPI002A13A093|nr:DUF4249 domain-containing protein [Draconibacterium sp. IB214405]MDX8338818.1 DUF4249 domain-containing protein [Draconibacterium sp. IB214405]